MIFSIKRSEEPRGSTLHINSLMEEENSLSNLLKELNGKSCLILTKNNLKYFTKKLNVIANTLAFEDKYGNQIVMAISEVTQVSEVKDDKGF